MNQSPEQRHGFSIFKFSAYILVFFFSPMCATCTAHLITLYFKDGKNINKNNRNFGSNLVEVAKETVEFYFNVLVPSGCYMYHHV